MITPQIDKYDFHVYSLMNKLLRGSMRHLESEGRRGRLNYFMLNLPYDCNYRCRKCCNSERGERASAKPLALEEIARLVREAKDLDAHVCAIAGEGEPLLDSRIRGIVTEIDDAGLIPYIFTNGSLLNEEMACFLMEHNASLVINVDSLRKETYELLCGVKGSFETVFKNLESARRIFHDAWCQIGEHILRRIAINTVVSPHNVKELKEISDFCGDEFVWVYNEPIRVGRARNAPDFENADCTAIQPSLPENIPLGTTSDGKWCGYMADGISVGTNGEILACAYALESGGKLGNARNGGLKHYIGAAKLAVADFYCTRGHSRCILRHPDYRGFIDALGEPKARIETKAVHGGERGRKRQHRSVTTPIEQSAAYYFDDTRQVIDFHEGRLPGIKYGRYGCPTQHAAEEKLAALENAERALLFSSGMGAITTLVLALVERGQHIIFTDECYRNTRKFFTEVLPRLGIGATEIGIDDLDGLGDYIGENKYALFFSEVPTNPFLRVIDLERVANFMKEREIPCVIDSTFASPINLRPMEYGADLVVHSATKYLGGHHDLFGGVVAGRQDLVDKIQQYRDVFGGIIDPHTSYLLLRSLQTLPLRMRAHNENGLAIARYLEEHSRVERVWYPGCGSHPDHALAKRQMDGFGGVITFSLRASEEETGRFVDSLRIPYIATNFGGPQSLVEQHAVLTFYKDRVGAERRGIGGNLLRYSVGFEHTADVIEDFENAFKVIS